MPTTHLHNSMLHAVSEIRNTGSVWTVCPRTGQNSVLLTELCTTGEMKLCVPSHTSTWANIMQRKSCCLDVNIKTIYILVHKTLQWNVQ